MSALIDEPLAQGHPGAPRRLTKRSDEAMTNGAMVISRTKAWLPPAVLALSLLGSGQPLALAPACLSLAVLAAVAIVRPASRDRIGVVASVPAGFTALVAWSVLWGLVGGTLGAGGWSSRSGSVMGIALFMAGTWFASRHRGQSVVLVGRDVPAAVGFTSLAVFFVSIIASMPLERWSRVSSTGTDFVRHLRMIQDVQAIGHLVPGEVVYPRALHALGAWMTRSMALEADIDTQWRSIAPLSLLMLALMLLAIMVVATRATDKVLGGRWWGPIAAAIAAGAFLQTAWFDVFLALGNLMNMIVGVALLGLLAFGAGPWRRGEMVGWFVAATTVVVAANAWQLLIPVAGLGSLPWVVDFLRNGRARVEGWVMWLGAASLTVHGLGLRPTGGQGVGSVRATSSWVSVSLLERPEWWWLVALAFAFIGAACLYRSGWRSWAASYVGMLAGGAAMVAGLMWLTESTWTLMLYYPVKALWTGMVVVVPIAAVGASYVVRMLWVGARKAPRTSRAGLRTAIAMGVVLVLAGVVGRGSAFPPHLAVLARGGPPAPNWSLAVIDAIKRDGVTAAVPTEGSIVFGVVPGADGALASGSYAGSVDYQAMEAIAIAGLGGASSEQVKGAILRRDTGELCRYLRDHPNTTRISGPDSKAGPLWLLDSGCPVAVVRPEEWVSLVMRPEWMERTPWAGGSWEFPTFGEVQAVRRSDRA